MDPGAIKEAFDSTGDSSLSSLYQIIPSRSTSTRLGALDFLNDERFVLPAENMHIQWQSAGKSSFRFLVDQSNPWQSSSRAHHAIDLLLLFRGIDLSFNPAADKVGQAMAASWIRFINGEDPWASGTRFTFGPFGGCKQIDEEEYAARRRAKHIDAVRKLGTEMPATLFAALAAGRISLLN